MLVLAAVVLLVVGGVGVERVGKHILNFVFAHRLAIIFGAADNSDPNKYGLLSLVLWDDRHARRKVFR